MALSGLKLCSPVQHHLNCLETRGNFLGTSRSSFSDNSVRLFVHYEKLLKISWTALMGGVSAHCSPRPTCVICLWFESISSKKFSRSCLRKIKKLSWRSKVFDIWQVTLHTITPRFVDAHSGSKNRNHFL